MSPSPERDGTKIPIPSLDCRGRLARSATGAFGLFCHQMTNRPLRDLDFKLEKLAMYSRCSPSRISACNSQYKSSHFRIYLRPSRSTPFRLLGPEPLETFAMPTNDSLRFNDNESLGPVFPDSKQSHPEQPVTLIHSRSTTATLECRELLSQRQVLQSQFTPGFQD